MDWIILAILFAAVDACIALTMQKSKISGDLLVFWRGVIPASILTPVIFLTDVKLPTDWLFYAATITTSILVVYTDKIKLTGPQKFGAGPYSRAMSLKVWVLFALWVAISDTYRQSLIDSFFENPLSLFMILAATTVGFLGMRRLKAKCTLTMETLIHISPAILLSALVSLFNKVAMDASGAFLSGVLVYAWVQALLIPNFKVGVNKFKNGIVLKDYFTKDVLKVGMFIGGLFLMLNMFKNSAIYLAPNPAYVILIAFLQPIIIVGINRLTGHEDTADKLGGFALVISVALLIIATQIL